jgi:hypothetical protein
MTVYVKMGLDMMGCAGCPKIVVLRDYALAGTALAAGEGKRSGQGPRW